MKRCAFTAAIFFTCAALAGVAPAFAQSTSTSANFALLHAPPGDSVGGGRMTGATVVADVSIGDPASGLVSNVTGGGVQAKCNFVGQLYDVASVSIAASPATINEGGTRQLTATATLDDATTLALNGLAAWDYSPPITFIDTNSGVATAGAVFQNMQTQILASYRGVTGNIQLNVLNVNPDNFGAYASDGLDDDWQVLYFGQPPNANAAPTADPDGDGRDNRLEFLSGFLPTDPESAFQFTISGFSSPGVMDFNLNKVIPGRTYTLKESSNLIAPFVTVSDFSASTEETDKLIQDPSAPSGRNFYIIEISKP